MRLHGFVPGTTVVLSGLTDADDRADVAAYLRSIAA
jgi:cytochrome c2